MLTLAYYYIAFGLISLVLGFLGFKKAGSRASLIAGGILGVVLMAGGALILGGVTGLGNLLAVVACVVLLAKFLPSFMRRRSFYPDGVMAGLAAIGAIAGIMIHLSLR